MLRKLYVPMLLALVITGTFSCKREIIGKEPDSLSPTKSLHQTQMARLGHNYREGELILGRQLQNPYTVTNMQNAYLAVTNRRIVSNNPVNIQTTHYYVKFKPQNWDQYDKLTEDTSIFLSDFPLDYEIDINGNRYHDPAVPDTLPTYQYTAVKTDYRFIDTIPYEILANLYIPEQDEILLEMNMVRMKYSLQPAMKLHIAAITVG